MFLERGQVCALSMSMGYFGSFAGFAVCIRMEAERDSVSD